MGSFFQSLRCAVRTAVRRPGLSLAVLLTFGLGIGLTTTVFSIVNGVLLKGLPFDEANRLVIVRRTDRAGEYRDVRAHDFADFRAQQTAFEGLAAFDEQAVNLAIGSGQPERFSGGFFTHDVLDVLRVRPVLGRPFREADTRPGADPVIILGYQLWQERFGGSPDVLGHTVRAHGATRTIVGVMPERFAFPFREQLWLPLVLDPAATPRGRGPSFAAFGRLKDGVSIAAAQAQLDAVSARLASAYPDTDRGLGASVRGFTEWIVGPEVSGLILTMLAAVVGVLLIACANVANLLLARASLRSREIAVRSALGAGRGRVVSQLVAETLALAAAGGALGFALGMAGVSWFERVIQVDPPPFWMRFDLDHRVLLFVLGATALAGVASSLFPALRASRTDVTSALKDEGRAGSSLRAGRFSSLLVGAEIATSCALLILSGLMIRSVVGLKTTDLPFATRNVFTAQFTLPAAAYPDAASRTRFCDQLLRRLAALPGAEAAALSDGLPASGSAPRTFEVDGASHASARDLPTARLGVITPGYFETFRVPVLRGRAFGPQDGREAQAVVAVNQSFARLFFPGGDVLGKRIRLGADGARDTTARWLTVVGVVPDLLMDGIPSQGGRPAGFYVPAAQAGTGSAVSIAVRTRGAPMASTAGVRAAVASIDPDLPIWRVMSMEGAFERYTWAYGVFGTLFTAFGLAALLLAAVGLYGVMAFSVARRTREMGIRMALGARGEELVLLVLRKGAIQLAAGLAIGLVAATLLAGQLQFLLFEVGARDPIVYGVVVAVLAAVGATAVVVPARRVTRVDPVIALGAE